MGIKLYRELQLEKPDMIVGWPGIGNIGIMAVDTLRELVGAEEFGEIEPWDFFYPSRVSIKADVLEELEFPRNKFYGKRFGKRDLIFFIGEEQATEKGADYAEGGKAYQLANLVLDVGEKFNCRRVYTSGAAVASIHHTMKPKVRAVPNDERLIAEVVTYEHTALMNEGYISGLNGLLLGVARERGLEGICVMGEIPVYIAHFPISYPKASKSVLEFLIKILKITVDLGAFDEYVHKVDEHIEGLYRQLPPELREHLDKFKEEGYTVPQESRSADEKGEKEFMEKIGKLFEDIDQHLKRGGERGA
jgi:proteasome assembly chaperone (PAC2) family protein